VNTTTNISSRRDDFGQGANPQSDQIRDSIYPVKITGELSYLIEDLMRKLRLLLSFIVSDNRI
jgi:hypothetical protein